LATFTLSIAIIGLLLGYGRGHSNFLNPMSAGPLSAKHANFTAEYGCVACHSVEALAPIDWLKAAISSSDMSEQCLKCHTFGGPERGPHNMVFPGRSALSNVTCIQCHTEHKGAEFDITRMSDDRCNSCHSVKFESFSEGHPDFPAKFPYEERTAIQFDHVTHWQKHFTDRRYQKRAPDACTACHRVESGAEHDIVTGTYDQTCASCHDKDISRRKFVLFRSPELLEDKLNPVDIQEACGIVAKTGPAQGEASLVPIQKQPYESMSFDEPTVLSGLLANVAIDAPETYGSAMQQMMLALARDDVTALRESLAQFTDEQHIENMLFGLDAEVVKSVACRWLANEEYESLSDNETMGWQADGLELRYQPTRHSDPVLKSWIEFALRASKIADDSPATDLARQFQEQLLSPSRGPGSCLKCHALSDMELEGVRQDLSVDWQYRAARSRTLTHFTHDAHVDALGAGIESCKTCHVLNPSAPYSESFEGRDRGQFASNFQPISKVTCLQCHGRGIQIENVQSDVGASSKAAKKWKKSEGFVRQDCLLCHAYHVGATLQNYHENSEKE